MEARDFEGNRIGEIIGLMEENNALENGEGNGNE